MSEDPVDIPEPPAVRLPAIDLRRVDWGPWRKDRWMATLSLDGCVYAARFRRRKREAWEAIIDAIWSVPIPDILE